MAMQVRMLGGFEIWRNDGAPIEIPSRKARALLACLARHADRPQSREALAARLWPDAPPENARGSLRQALKQLRRLLGAQVIGSKGDMLALRIPSTQIDVAEFEKLSTSASAEALERALALYLGDFLDGIPPPTDAVLEWTVFERGELREQATATLVRLAEIRLAPESPPEKVGSAIRVALRLLALDPLQEPVHRLLMRLYLRLGRRGDAAAQYQLCRDILARDLDVAPDPETQELYHAVRDAPAPDSAVPPTGPTVEVVGFRNLGGDRADDYFAEGLAEDLVAALLRWRSFPVIVGPAVTARYRLTGSVRRQGRQVRIAVQLSDCQSGARLWAERYDRDLDDIFTVQDEITLRIAATVAPELSRAELERSRAKRPDDLDAWDCVLRGMARMRERTAPGHLEARALFRRAAALRPDYAEAHAGMASSYNMNIVVGGETDRMAAARAALTAARQAVALDPGSAMAHQELSTAYQWLDRTEEALAEIRIAVELNPYDAVGLHQLGNKSDLAGDPRGIGYMEQAHRLNPAEMQVAPRLAFLARAYLNAGNFAKAEESARRAVRLRAVYAPAHYILGLALGGLGRSDEGLAALARCDALEPGFVAGRRDWAPYRAPESNARLHTALARVAAA